MQTYFTPTWLAIAFSLAILVPPFMITRCAYTYAPAQYKKSTLMVVAGFFILYFGYILLLAKTGAYTTVSLPPKILLITTLPYAILLFGIVYRLKITQTIVHHTPVSALISLHIFRLVGLTFILLAVYEALPSLFSWLAGTGDVLTAVSSIWVAKKVSEKSASTKKIAWFWNTFGLLDIIITALLANVLTKISIDTGAMGVDTLTKIPYCIIPAFAPPTIIFLHLLIYQKLKTSI